MLFFSYRYKLHQVPNLGGCEINLVGEVIAKCLLLSPQAPLRRGNQSSVQLFATYRHTAQPQGVWRRY